MKLLARLVLISCAYALGALSACDPGDPSYAVVRNDSLEAEEGNPDATPRMVVYKVWWSIVLFAEPLAPEQSSEPARVVPERDYAYALLAPGWDESSDEAPERLIPVRTKGKWEALLGRTLLISIASDSVLGDCTHGEPLSQEDADFITQRIFPGEFAGRHYDAATCELAPSTAEAGVDAAQ